MARRTITTLGFSIPRETAGLDRSSQGVILLKEGMAIRLLWLVSEHMFYKFFDFYLNEENRLYIIGGWLGQGPFAADDMHILDLQ